MMRTTLIGAGMLAALLAGCAGGNGSEAVDTSIAEAQSFAWPLTVASGKVRCENGGILVFTSVDGQDYALNGSAKSAGYADIKPIWKDDPSTGAKVDISPLISYSQQFCR